MEVQDNAAVDDTAVTDVVELNSDAAEISELSDSISEASAATDEITEIQDVAAKSIESGEGLPEAAVEMMMVSLKSINRRLGIKGDRSVFAVPATEAFGTTKSRLAATKAVLEEAEKGKETIIETIKRWAKQLWEWVSKFFANILDRDKKNVAEAEKVVKKVKDTQKLQKLPDEIPPLEPTPEPKGPSNDELNKEFQSLPGAAIGHYQALVKRLEGIDAGFDFDPNTLGLRFRTTKKDLDEIEEYEMEGTELVAAFLIKCRTTTFVISQSNAIELERAADVIAKFNEKTKELLADILSKTEKLLTNEAEHGKLNPKSIEDIKSVASVLPAYAGRFSTRSTTMLTQLISAATGK